MPCRMLHSQLYLMMTPYQDAISCQPLDIAQVRRRDAHQRRVVVAQAKYDPSDEGMLPAGQLLAASHSNPSNSSSGGSSPHSGSSSKPGPARPPAASRASSSGSSFSSMASGAHCRQPLGVYVWGFDVYWKPVLTLETKRKGW